MILQTNILKYMEEKKIQFKGLNPFFQIRPQIVLRRLVICSCFVLTIKLCICQISSDEGRVTKIRKYLFVVNFFILETAANNVSPRKFTILNVREFVFHAELQRAPCLRA